MTENDALKRAAESVDNPQSTVFKDMRRDISADKQKAHAALAALAETHPITKVKTVKPQDDFPDIPPELKRKNTPATKAAKAKHVKADADKRSGTGLANPPNGEASRKKDEEFERKAKALGVETPKARKRKALDKLLKAKGKAPIKTARQASGKATGGNNGGRKGTKLALVVALLKRPQGCTSAEVLQATGWPAVSMPQQAKAAGLKLVKEKKPGEVTRYRAS